MSDQTSITERLNPRIIDSGPTSFASTPGMDRDTIRERTLAIERVEKLRDAITKRGDAQGNIRDLMFNNYGALVDCEQMRIIIVEGALGARKVPPDQQRMIFAYWDRVLGKSDGKIERIVTNTTIFEKLIDILDRRGIDLGTVGLIKEDLIRVLEES